MKHPNLKTKGTDFETMLFAFLWMPDADIRSDEELYAAVRQYGKAVIVPWDHTSFVSLPPLELTPEEFEQKWRGD